MVDHFGPTNDELLLMFFGQTMLELEELILHGRQMYRDFCFPLSQKVIFQAQFTFY